MSIKKIPCGGWLYDDEQITFEDGVMKVIGGGGISEAPIDGKQYARKDAEWSEVQSGGGGGMVVHFTIQTVDDTITLLADKTPAEVKSAMLSGAVVGTIVFPWDTEPSPIGSATLTSETTIGFLPSNDNENLKLIYTITCNESFTEWLYNQG